MWVGADLGIVVRASLRWCHFAHVVPEAIFQAIWLMSVGYTMMFGDLLTAKTFESNSSIDSWAPTSKLSLSSSACAFNLRRGGFDEHFTRQQGKQGEYRYASTNSE